jgi:hypothetical protein
MVNQAASKGTFIFPISVFKKKQRQSSNRPPFKKVPVRQDLAFAFLSPPVLKNPNFWDVTPCSPLESMTCHLLSRWYHFGLNRPRRWRRYIPPETSVAFQRTTRRYIPHDNNIHNHRSQYPNFNILLSYCSSSSKRTR